MNNYTAATAGKYFWPSSFLGWLIIIILILIIIVVARKLYLDYQNQKSLKKVDANHIENLPT